jgi:hypothetical protein
LKKLISGIFFATCLSSGTAMAQVMGSADSILPDLAVRGQGWAQLQNPAELWEFGLALIETTLMVAFLAYHPVSIATRRLKTDFDAPRALFIYGLIGMVVGFLIMHHGYLIGFVLFGLGGLMRFRTDEASADTRRMILVTLIGLCVGLNLPVIALITTISSWVVLYVLGGRVKHAIEVKFSEEEPTKDAMVRLREHLAEQGYETVSMTKTKFKPTVHYVVESTTGSGRSGLEREMSRLTHANQYAVEDWHID